MTGRRASKAGVACGVARSTRGAENVGHLLAKTKMCAFFMEGKCQRGRACTFAHDESELHDQPDLFRSQLCTEFSQMGTCRYGAGCRFAHGADQLRPAAVAAESQDRHQGRDEHRLRRRLAAMKEQTKALEAQLEAINPTAQHCAEDDWAFESCWAVQVSCASTESGCTDAGTYQGWEDACSWGPYYMGDCATVGMAAAPVVPMAVFVAPAPWPPMNAEYEAASETSTDCDGGVYDCGGSSGVAESATDADDNDDAASTTETARGEFSPAAVVAEEGPRIIVRNTFIEYEYEAAEPAAGARRRSQSAPCRRAQ